MRTHPPDSERGLLFDWEADDRSLPRLALAGVATVLGIGGLFVIFRVAAPEAPRPTALSRQVLVLNPEIPAERALIHQAMDRSFPILPVESGPVPRVPAVLPRLVPSYLGHELKLRPLPADFAEMSTPPLVTTTMSLLPPPAPAPPGPDTAPRKQVLRAFFEGGLAARAPQRVEIPGVPLAETARPVFHVIVDARGRVVAALPLAPAEVPEMTANLRDVVAELIFQPAGDGAVEQGQVSFRWEDEAP